MALHIDKDRSNIYNIELQETVEEFVENINKGLNSFDSLSKSVIQQKTFYEWDSSYKTYNKSMNDIANNKDYTSWSEYKY